MPRYGVRLHGTGRISVDGQVVRAGYATVRFVDAASEFEAPAAARALFLTRSARPVADEWTCEWDGVFAARWWRYRFGRQPGMAFYSLDDADAEALDGSDHDANEGPDVRIFRVEDGR